MKPVTFSLILLAAIAIIAFGYSNKHVTTTRVAIVPAPQHHSVMQQTSLIVAPPVDTTKKRLPNVAQTPVVAAIDSTVGTDSTDMPEGPYDPTADLAPDEMRIYKIMDTSAMAMFQKHDTVKVMSEMMSRCPSGYQYWTTDTNTAATVRYGAIQYFKGCDGKEICKFRIDVLTGLVLLKPKRSKEYLTVREFERKHWGKAS